MAIVFHDTVQKEVGELQTLRKLLHDAYIVEKRAGSCDPYEDELAPALTIRRTVDKPTLTLLKSANYPFLVCEEAPPSYIPPPVPYDVKCDVDNMKRRVMQIQRGLAAYLERNGYSHINDSVEMTNQHKEAVVQFLSESREFAELVWEVNSLQAFHRWVLSHSISCLWNAKDELEYVLTEKGETLPITTEEMDACLAKLSFSEAANILETDRKSVVALEQRRMHSKSHTYRERLPVKAITAATSCYLSPEEKYMYQEFFNESEHWQLLLSHALLVQQFSSWGGTAALHASSPKEILPSSKLHFTSTDALIPRSKAALVLGSFPTSTNVEDVTRRTLNALQAEHEVITNLMQTIEERKISNIHFYVSEEECLRSRTAQIAVYGCILSDMKLMADQMSIVQIFLNKFREWLQIYGFGDQNELMQRLLERSGLPWPIFPINDNNAEASGTQHTHFIPPTVKWHVEQQQQQQRQKGLLSEASSNPSIQEKERNGSGLDLRVPTGGKTYHTHLTFSPSASTATQPSNEAADAKGETAAKAPLPRPAATAASSAYHLSPVARGSEGSHRKNTGMVESTCEVESPSKRSVGRSELTVETVVDAFYGLLQHVSTLTRRALQQQQPPQQGKPTKKVLTQMPLERLWQIVTLRFAIFQLVRRDWVPSALLELLAAVEDGLIRKLENNEHYGYVVPYAAALVVGLQGLLLLLQDRAPQTSPRWVDVRVILHDSRAGGDLFKEASFATSSVELCRWGAVLDALWFQTDPSTSVHGGLLNAPLCGVPDSALNGRPVGFLRLEQVSLPRFVSTQSSLPPMLYMSYRLDSSDAEQSGKDGQWRTAAQPVWSVARSLRTICEECVETYSGDADMSTIIRYQYARRVLQALLKVELKGLLPCFACRVEECDQLRWYESIFISSRSSGDPSEISSIANTAVGLLPPAAMELIRLQTNLRLKNPQPASDDNDPESPFALYEFPINFSSIGLLLSTVLSRIAIPKPVLRDLYTLAESLKEEALHEIRTDVVPKAFVNATTHPIPTSCLPAKRRAISIQRDSTANQNSVSLRRFISPIIKHVEDYFANLKEEGNLSLSKSSPNASSGGIHSATRPRRGVHQFLHSTTTVPSRATINQGSREETDKSPSPSAVRPGRG